MNEMQEMPNDLELETRVQNLAKTLPFPPTPDIAASLRHRRRRVNSWRLAQVAVTVLIVLAALLAVPDIRAGVIAFFRIGAVEVQVTTATPPATFQAPNGELPVSVLSFPGATTLGDAREHFGYPIDLPGALPAPDRVYLIQALKPMVVMAWLEANGGVDVSLHLMPPGTYALKMYEGELEETQVNGGRALWLPNPHMYLLQTRPEKFDRRQVLSHALVWESDNGMTYRLETERPLDEALRIAESIPAGND